ncbi:rab effector Noc2-like isoform X2 [Tachysurus ichikawai]
MADGVQKIKSKSSGALRLAFLCRKKKSLNLQVRHSPLTVDSSESDGSDSELSDASSDRNIFIPESIKRRHSALSESSGSVGLPPQQFILSSPSRASFLSGSHSSLSSERGSLAPAPEDEDKAQGRTSSCE